MIAVNGLEDGSISVSRLLHLLYLLPSLTCFLTYTSLPPLCHPPLHGFIMATHQRSASLSLLMAQLLALMHFKRTAAATSRSEWKDMSSSNLHNLCPFFLPILCLGSNVVHFMSTLLRLCGSGHHQQPLWVADNNVVNNILLIISLAWKWF